LNGLTDGLDWNDLQSSPGKVFAAAFDSAPGGVGDPTAQLNRSFLACTSNQFAEGTVFSTYGGSDPGSAHELEVRVNTTITAHSITGYEYYINCSGAATGLIRWNGALGDFTAFGSFISTATVPVEGDVLRIENDNGTLNCYQNGILRITGAESTFTGGNPGLGNNPVAGGSVALNGAGFKLWRCGNL
jgi:hypothetical protein